MVRLGLFSAVQSWLFGPIRVLRDVYPHSALRCTLLFCVLVTCLFVRRFEGPSRKITV